MYSHTRLCKKYSTYLNVYVCYIKTLCCLVCSTHPYVDVFNTPGSVGVGVINTLGRVGCRRKTQRLVEHEANRAADQREPPADAEKEGERGGGQGIWEGRGGGYGIICEGSGGGHGRWEGRGGGYGIMCGRWGSHGVGFWMYWLACCYLIYHILFKLKQCV